MELGRFVKLVAAARAAYWGGSYADDLGANTLAADLCRALAAFPDVRGEGSLLRLAAAATLDDGFQGSALVWLRVFAE